jgi:hypothetical protein
MRLILGTMDRGGFLFHQILDTGNALIKTQLILLRRRGKHNLDPVLLKPVGVKMEFSSVDAVKGLHDLP